MPKELLKDYRPLFVGLDALLPLMDGTFRCYTNLDNAASTPTFAPIWTTVKQVWRQPEDVHQAVIQEVKEGRHSAQGHSCRGPRGGAAGGRRDP